MFIRKKQKKRLQEIENKILGLEQILKMAIKCDVCGKKAEYKIFRRYLEKPIDNLFCNECYDKQ